MAKQTRNQKVNHLQTHQGKGASYEQSESYDDSLLPDAAELCKLKELDENIIEWIKDRTAKEQDARISFNDRKMGLLEGATRKAFHMDIIVVIAAFFILIAGMLVTSYLVSQNLKIEGTVFGGVTLLAVGNSFLNFTKRKDTNPDKKKQL